MSPASGHELVALPSVQLTDGLGVFVGLFLSLVLVLIVMPSFIRKMRAGGMVGKDVNKSSKPEVAELGGIAALFAFSVSLSLVVGIQKLLGNVAEDPFLAAISVFFMAAMVHGSRCFDSYDRSTLHRFHALTIRQPITSMSMSSSFACRAIAW